MQLARTSLTTLRCMNGPLKIRGGTSIHHQQCHIAGSEPNPGSFESPLRYFAHAPWSFLAIGSSSRDRLARVRCQTGIEAKDSVTSVMYDKGIGASAALTDRQYRQ